MSRTDKDMPWEIRAKKHKPVHYYCEFDFIHWWGWHRYGPRDCDLPERPGTQYLLNFPWRSRFPFRGEPHCQWEPKWDRRYYTKPPDHEDRRLYWWGPDRARLRAWCHEARKEYQGSGSTLDLEPTEQHRHHPINGWWD